MSVLLYTTQEIKFEYTFAAGDAFTAKDAMNYAFLGDTAVPLWITPTLNVAGGSPISTGDPVQIFCSYGQLAQHDIDTYVRWVMFPGGNDVWTIHFPNDSSSGQQIPLGQQFVLWNQGKSLALCPKDGNFCGLGTAEAPWGFTASAVSSSAPAPAR